ncbi:MAG: molybdopterin cofactor-binding domain-containing protein, partial [Spirochaetia bacterium]
MKTRDPHMHVQGKSVFVDDISLPKESLFCAVLFSPAAKGRIRTLSTEDAKAQPGVRAVVTAKDIPGENQIGTIILDEQLLAEEEVHFIGQPIAAVYAETEVQARRAVKKIILEIDEEDPIVDPRAAYEAGEIIAPPRTFQKGDADSVFDSCAYVFEGTSESGGQEHFYMECQGAVAFPQERGCFSVISSTQSPTTVQKIVARVLGLSMNAVEVDVRRLGGAFGGKEDQANPWAALAAIGAYLTAKPVKLVLRRAEDMRVTGKRHPYSTDWKIGFSEDGKIQAFQAFYYQNAGAAADLSTAILERTLFHITGSYYVPNVTATAVCCRTNLPPFTAFRGFGGPQAMFVMESALFYSSDEMGIPLEELQEMNLLAEGDELPFGMKLERCNARLCWEELVSRFHTEQKITEIDKFNIANSRYKKTYAFMPVCFGISFTNTMLNQARALVNVYLDGSIGVSTGAIEMGQGVNQKITDIVSRTFSVPEEKIKLETTNTTRVANTSATAASTGSDLNGKAAELACRQILDRIYKVASKLLDAASPADLRIQDGVFYNNGGKTDLTWDAAVKQAYLSRTNLSAQAHYATPNIYFDKTKEKGKPFAYHVYGT